MSLADVAHLMLARYRMISGDNVPSKSQFRTIVVVGAGASHAACGLPLGGALADKARARVLKQIPAHLIERELERLRNVNRMQGEDLETLLLALSKYDPNAVIDVLRQECGYAHYPSYTYEILAHLMKHGFLDAIVNFNFDELLDQAIDEEVGTDRYMRIVRDGEWSLQLRPDGEDPFRFDRPLYIKPHGTVSDPASLRFTRDAYFELPPDLANLLRALVQGQPVDRTISDIRPQKSAPLQTRPACVLAIGHSLQSFEFNKLFEQCPEETQLHIVCGDGRGRRSEWPKRMRNAAHGRNIPIRIKEPGALDKRMLQIWNEIVDQAKKFAAPDKSWMRVRGIQRHELIAHFFRPRRPANLFRKESTNPSPDERHALERYFSDRLTIEAMLAIAKAKGFVDLRELDRGRTGRFYRKLCEIQDPAHPGSLTDRLEALGMERRDPSVDSYWHKSVPRSSVPKRPLTVTSDTYKRSTRAELIKDCEHLLSDNRRDRLREKNSQGFDGATLMANALDEMFSGDDVELAPERRVSFRLKFKAASTLRTLAELRRETHLLLEGPADLLLCVAESGEWLCRPEIRQHITRQPVGAIISDPKFQPDLSKLKVKVKWLPWHQHNRHMTMRLISKGDLPEPDRAIYFERRYRSPVISPVVLTDRDDLEYVISDFTLYWLKAERHRRKKSDLIAMGPEDLKQEWRRIVRTLWRKQKTRSAASRKRTSSAIAA
jgi:hypothetical protein